MSNTTGVLYEAGTAYPSHLGSRSVFGGVHVAHRFSFLCYVVYLCFVCLCPVPCVPNFASVT